MLSAFDLWILIPETRTLWVLIAENVRLTEVNFACTCGSLWFSDSAVCGEWAVTQPERHRASHSQCTRMKEEDVGLAKGPGKGMPGVRAGEEGVSCQGSCPSVTPCTPLQGVWWDNGMSPCHHHYWSATLHLPISFLCKLQAFMYFNWQNQSVTSTVGHFTDDLYLVFVPLAFEKWLKTLNILLGFDFERTCYLRWQKTRE